MTLLVALVLCEECPVFSVDRFSPIICNGVLCLNGCINLGKLVLEVLAK